MVNLTRFEADHMDYFRAHCTTSWAKYFENPLWENLTLEFAYREPSIYHATLAIAALTRCYLNRPSIFYCDPKHSNTSVVEYSTEQYTMAIQCLNSRLDESSDSIELATLGSVLFIHIEWLQSTTTDDNNDAINLRLKQSKTQIAVHFRGGLRLVQNLRCASRDADHLESALLRMGHLCLL
jgi:hypothetical protein